MLVIHSLQYIRIGAEIYIPKPNIPPAGITSIAAPDFSAYMYYS